MLPWKSIIRIDKTSEAPVYLQISNTLILQIKHGIIKPGTKIPGTRALALMLNLNRQTIVRAYDELYAQGWLDAAKSKGTFVSEKLPEVTPKKLIDPAPFKNTSRDTGFSFRINKFIHEPADPSRDISGFHDGPDVRLVPVGLLSRYYKSVITRKTGQSLLSYVRVEGRQKLREEISDYLNNSRGLNTSSENIIISRGTQMAMFMLATVLISKGDIVVTADIGYRYGDIVFLHAGARLKKVKVDDDGLVVDQIEKICKTQKVRAVFVTPHHHYPTTVTMSASRRMQLLQLSEKYGFIIIEDDYDFEFHFESSPILPLASADRQGLVVYIGSLSKTLSPAIRIGYICAPSNLIKELSKMRQLFDAQGDPVIEQVIAEMLEDGVIRRHTKKAMKIYRERRDFMCENLNKSLADFIHFKTPEGGLAIWANFDKRLKVPQLSVRLREKGIVLPKGLLYKVDSNQNLNATRMGYGWMNLHESERAISILKNTIHQMI